MPTATFHVQKSTFVKICHMKTYRRRIGIRFLRKESNRKVILSEIAVDICEVDNLTFGESFGIYFRLRGCAYAIFILARSLYALWAAFDQSKVCCISQITLFFSVVTVPFSAMDSA